ncbi:Hypothetical protein PHPALM_7728 [Phytophthora palmivora]|uniref:Calcineurin-like phosphoesterase domain-containing protein n=1 Tax=Phytophthora palmivora TaxID=4796 RepID=A0A2P4YBM1_9STRA|nr:Hypothetical protein PHPALM_7728 [Phytophthora palmivora]
MCENVKRGDSLCAGGNNGMFDACMDKLQAWGDDSREKLVEAAKASNATWKIVNTHYSPYNHYAPGPAENWRELLDGLGIQLFLYGHTHGEKHDYTAFKTHFIENGAGGGIQNESPSGIPPYAEDYVENVWAAGHYPYGFFSLNISPKWLKVLVELPSNIVGTFHNEVDEAKAVKMPRCNRQDEAGKSEMIFLHTYEHNP